MKAPKIAIFNNTAIRNGKDLGLLLGAALITSSLMMGTFSLSMGWVQRKLNERKMKKMMAEAQAQMEAMKEAA